MAAAEGEQVGRSCRGGGWGLVAGGGGVRPGWANEASGDGQRGGMTDGARDRGRRGG